MKGWPLSCCCVSLLCLLPGSLPAAESSKPPPPAKLKVSGYGLLGNRELKSMLRTVELNRKKPPVLGPSLVEDCVALIAARLLRDGYLEPDIDLRLELAGGGRIQTTARALVDNPLPGPLQATRVEFRIRKGRLYHFQTLEFSGLTSINEKQARSFFEETETLLHPRSARIYTPERLRQGLSSLTSALDRLGYQQATAEAEQLRRDDTTGDVSVRIRVREGPKFIVLSARIEVFHPDSPEPATRREAFPNQPYSKLWAQDFALALKTNEYARGFPDVTVDLRPLQSRPEGNRVQVDLLAAVKTGPKVWIAAVEFDGQRRTRQRLMTRRARVERGELLNPIQVEQGRLRLARLGIFDNVDLNYKTVDEHSREVIYRVKESKALNVSLLGGWGSYELLRGGVIVSENNIFGLAHHAELEAVQSFKSSSGDFRYTVPELVGRDVDLFVHGSGLRRDEVDFTRLEYGGGLGVHKYFTAPALDASLHYDYQILSALNTIPQVASEGLTNPAVSSVTAELKLDRRDSVLYPRQGYKVFATIESASDCLGGDANYERIEISPSWYHPLGGGRYLGVSLSHGVDFSFGSVAHNLPFNKRFFPGGPESIRGYRQGEAAPRNQQGEIVGAETYTLGTVQLEQALTRRWSLIFFSDSIGFARQLDHYPFDITLFSAGGGIWWKSVIGPVRLEYGHNLNPRRGDPSGAVQFSLGFPF